jgi:type VI secretion system Hcp family effector
MSRISMICISLMAPLVFSANAASAGSVVVHTTTPNVKVQAPHTNIGSQSSGSGAGKVTFNPFSVTKKVDKSSPNLYQNTVTGKHISTGKITVRKSGGDSPVAYDKTKTTSTPPTTTTDTTSGGKTKWIELNSDK